MCTRKKHYIYVYFNVLVFRTETKCLRIYKVTWNSFLEFLKVKSRLTCYSLHIIRGVRDISVQILLKAPNLAQKSPMSYCLHFWRAPYGTSILAKWPPSGWDVNWSLKTKRARIRYDTSIYGYIGSVKPILILF